MLEIFCAISQMPFRIRFYRGSNIFLAASPNLVEVLAGASRHLERLEVRIEFLSRRVGNFWLQSRSDWKRFRGVLEIPYDAVVEVVLVNKLSCALVRHPAFPGVSTLVIDWLSGYFDGIEIHFQAGWKIPF